MILQSGTDIAFCQQSERKKKPVWRPWSRQACKVHTSGQVPASDHRRSAPRLITMSPDAVSVVAPRTLTCQLFSELVGKNTTPTLTKSATNSCVENT